MNSTLLLPLSIRQLKMLSGELFCGNCKKCGYLDVIVRDSCNWTVWFQNTKVSVDPDLCSPVAAFIVAGTSCVFFYVAMLSLSVTSFSLNCLKNGGFRNTAFAEVL